MNEWYFILHKLRTLSVYKFSDGNALLPNFWKTVVSILEFFDITQFIDVGQNLARDLYVFQILSTHSYPKIAISLEPKMILKKRINITSEI